MNSKIIISILLVLSNSLFSQISQNMKKLAQRDELLGVDYNDVWGYTSPQGIEYAIIGSTRSVGIYNLADCSNPNLIYEYVDGLDDFNYWRDFDCYQNVMYGISDTGSEGLKIFNLQNMNNITVTQSTTHFLKAHTLYIDSVNARLYISGSRDSNPGNNNWLVIFDISTPLSPQLLVKIRLNDIDGMQGTENLYIHDLFAEDNIVYASQGYAGFYVWDCNDVNNITYLGHIDDNNNYNHSSWKHPNFNGDTSYFYIAEELPTGMPIKVLRTIKNDDDVTITLRNRFKHPLEAPAFNNPRPHNPYVKDNGLFISYYMDGVQVYDVTNPEKPFRVAYYDTFLDNNGNGYGMDNGFNGVWSVYPFLESGCILAADMTYGLITLKLNFPKVKINDNILLTQPGAGIVFRDSSNVYRKISADNDGLIVYNIVTQNDNDFKIDSSDLELINFNRNIFFTSPIGDTYKLVISETGSLHLRQEPIPTTDFISFNGDILINDKHRGLILSSSASKRWKVGVKNNGSLTTYRTSF